MRVLVCGGRRFTDKAMLERVLDSLHEQTPFTMLIHGAARGADSLADAWAHYAGVSIYRCHAHWKQLGNSAGPERNARMLAKGKPDLVVAFPGRAGTSDMVRKALAAGVKVKRVRPDGQVVDWLSRIDLEPELQLDGAPL